jgi:hypothetical protein
MSLPPPALCIEYRNARPPRVETCWELVKREFVAKDLKA